MSAVPLIKTQPQPGSRFCSKCWASIAPDCIFCTKCGAKLPDKPVTENVKTAEPPVTAPIQTNNDFSGENTVAKEPDTVSSDASGVPGAVNTENTSNDRVCPDCGTVIGEGHMFCTQCGHKF